jgi:hypothetical protein
MALNAQGKAYKWKSDYDKQRSHPTWQSYKTFKYMYIGNRWIFIISEVIRSA